MSEGLRDYELVVRTADLRRAFAAVMDHVEETFGDEVSIDHDLFWAVAMDERSDLLKDPEVTIGSLETSLDCLMRSVDDDEVISYLCVWLGELLEAIGLMGYPRAAPAQAEVP